MLSSPDKRTGAATGIDGFSHELKDKEGIWRHHPRTMGWVVEFAKTADAKILTSFATSEGAHASAALRRGTVTLPVASIDSWQCRMRATRTAVEVFGPIANGVSVPIGAECKW